MTTAIDIHALPRQVLVNLGNRYAVFGHAGAPPDPLYFDPARDSELLLSVADEPRTLHDRIIQTLRVSGMERAITLPLKSAGDIAFIDKDGNATTVEVKVKSGELKPRDFDQAAELLRSSHSGGDVFEVWFFNIERLKLTTFSLTEGQLHIDELHPINVWEKTETGIFDRNQVVSEMNIWVSRGNCSPLRSEGALCGELTQIVRRGWRWGGDCGSI